MFIEIEILRKTCVACLRHAKYQISNHPVFSNTVSNYNAEISIDFLWRQIQRCYNDRRRNQQKRSTLPNGEKSR